MCKLLREVLDESEGWQKELSDSPSRFHCLPSSHYHHHHHHLINWM